VLPEHACGFRWISRLQSVIRTSIGDHINVDDMGAREFVCGDAWERNETRARIWLENLKKETIGKT